MCTVKEIMVGGRLCRIADIKEKYISNIIDAAGKCDLIDRVVLFGSCLGENCTEESDIDLAIFGSKNPSQVLGSKKYESFARQLYSFNDHAQSYDLLYFKTGSKKGTGIMDSIDKGEVLYERFS